MTPRNGSAASPLPGSQATPRKQSENDHDYLRSQVDPVLMPLIEALLLYQPDSIYDFIHDYVDEQKTARFGDARRRVHGGVNGGYAKKLTNRRKMVDFMSTSVIPVMDDLAHQILREKPISVPLFIKELMAARIIMGSSSSTTDNNQYEYVAFREGDRVLSRYKGRPRYYPGVIESIDAATDAFTVRYDDGKTEHNVHRMCLKPAELAPRKSSRRASKQDDQSMSGASKAGNNQSEGEGEGETQANASANANGMDTDETTASPPREMAVVILIIGIDGAGKTTLLSTLQGDLEKEHVPSAGFTSISFQTETGSATFYDLGGGPAFRGVWTEYYADAHGVMFIVDSSSDAAVKESETVLHASMAHEAMTDKPLLIFANKQDRASALAEDQLFHALQLSTLPGAKLVPCIAKPSENGTMVDDRLEQGLQWLLDEVHADFDTLSARVQQDLAIKQKLNDERRAAQRARVSAWKEERERNGMALQDDWQHARGEDENENANQGGNASQAKSKGGPEESDEIKCHHCTTAAAVTKCAASKWMPVCEGCAEALKLAAAAAVQGNQ